MKKTTALLFTAALAGFAAPAAAQDFSGFRVEAHGGWDNVKSEINTPDPDADEDEDTLLTVSGSHSDIVYGGEIGYDFQVGRGLVLGAYGSMDFASGKVCDEVFGDDLACIGAGRSFTAGVRAGVPVGQSVLLYAKGGWSNGKLKLSYDEDVEDNDDEDAGEIQRLSETLSGWHAGAGAEFRIAGNIYAKAEYVYTKFSDKDYALGDTTDPVLSIGSDRHQVLAGFGVRF